MDRLEILMLAANPAGVSSPNPQFDRHLGPTATERPRIATYSHLQLDREIKYIRACLEAGRFRDRVTLDSRLAVSPDDLLAAIDERRANVLHFAGHSDETGIILADEQNRPVFVGTDPLMRALKAVGGRVELVLLNSCAGSEVARAMAAVCGCAIGMREAIRDDAAWTFSRAFYRAMANGRSVENAFDQGKAALAFRGMKEEELPQLVAVGVDPSTMVLSDGGSADRTGIPAPKPRPRKLTQDEIEAVVEAAAACDLPGRRRELVAGLPPMVRLNLPDIDLPIGQVRSDLNTLNQMGRVRGSDVPVLALWLRAAEFVAGYTEESDVFTRMREQLAEG